MKRRKSSSKKKLAKSVKKLATLTRDELLAALRVDMPAGAAPGPPKFDMDAKPAARVLPQAEPVPAFFQPGKWRVEDAQPYSGKTSKPHFYMGVDKDPETGAFARIDELSHVAYSPPHPEQTAKKYRMSTESMFGVEDRRLRILNLKAGIEVPYSAGMVNAHVESIKHDVASNYQDEDRNEYPLLLVKKPKDNELDDEYIVERFNQSQRLRRFMTSKLFASSMSNDMKVGYDSVINNSEDRAIRAELFKLKTIAHGIEVYGSTNEQTNLSSFETFTVPIARMIDAHFPLIGVSDVVPPIPCQAPAWPSLQEPPLTHECGSKETGEVKFYRRMGTKPKKWCRWPTSRKIFEKKPPAPEPTYVVLDCSGSMNYEEEDFHRFFHNAPKGTVTGYSGDVFVRLAHNGKMVNPEWFGAFPGDNKSDLRALYWLAKQPGKRYWVSDGRIDTPTQEYVQELHRTVKVNGIRRVGSMDEMIKQVKKGYSKPLPALPKEVFQESGLPEIKF